MPPDILADESLDFRIVTEPQKKGFHVISIIKDYQGSSDKKVLDLARQYKAILITEDSDFGEWIFAHKERGVSVVFFWDMRRLYELVKNQPNLRQLVAEIPFDFLFYHTKLHCYMVIELKVGDFKPEYAAKINILFTYF